MTAQPLGYHEAADFQLYRSNEGIVSKLEGEGRFNGLLNYPTVVRFSGRAIRKMDSEFNGPKANRSTIEIFANLNTGKKVSLFSINTNFFGKVQHDRETTQGSIDYPVKNFIYDPVDQSFESVSGSERSFSISSPIREMGQEDVISSFGANYLLGAFFSEETYPFTPKLLDVNAFPEQILLDISVKDNEDWELSICQRGEGGHGRH